jgi:hypothetical protein
MHFTRTLNSYQVDCTSCHAEEKTDSHASRLRKANRSELPKPVRFRLLFIVGLIWRTIGFLVMMRLRPGGRYTMLARSQMVTERFERLGWRCVDQSGADHRDAAGHFSPGILRRDFATPRSCAWISG